MMSHVQHLSFWLLLTCAVGCNATIERPRWFRPGDIRSQQYRAVEHDPYPSIEVGPEVVGGRPREYQQELPAPIRHMPDRVLGADGTWWAR